MRDKLQELLMDSVMRSTNVRLEVGTAHRYNVEDTIQINGHPLIITRFVSARLHRWAMPTSKRTIGAMRRST